MILEARNLSCLPEWAPANRYLFRNLSFKLTSGQLLLVQGDNGSGKSTLLKILSGLRTPNKGSLFWDGKPISCSFEVYCENMAFLGHLDGLKKSLTIDENIDNQLGCLGRAKNAQKITEVLTLLEILQHRKRFCKLLSAGQRRKSALSALILKEKKCWIVDEPFTFLDKRSANTLQKLFIEHVNKGGILILATHQHSHDSLLQWETVVPTQKITLTC